MTNSIVTNTTSAPYPAIVRVVTTFPNGVVFSGSGVVVGDNDVLTAAHMVYSGAHGLARTVVVYPGQNGGSSPFGSYTASSIAYIPIDEDGNGSISRAESVHDFAVLGFSTDIDDRTGRMSLYAGFTSGTVTLDGYPGSYGGTTLVENTGTTSVSAGILDIAAFDTSPGNSGGPVWTMSSGGASVVGIVSTRNWAAFVGGADYATLQGWIGGNDGLLTPLVAGSPTSPPPPPPATATDFVFGGAGDDTVGTGASGGRVNGMEGNDSLTGERGNDTLYGDGGDDSALGFAGRDQIFGGEGRDLANGNQGDDLLYGAGGHDTLFGGQDNDILYGEDGDDVLNGNKHADLVYGGAGVDFLFGGQNDDLLFGDGGNDTLSGDLGNDTLNGGGGADRFVLGPIPGHDLIVDFRAGDGDQLQLATGTSFTTASTAGGVVVSLSGGGSVTLQGVTTGVESSWIAFA
jgi:Ca2+-binding RTX toxin-like protein